MGGTLRYWGIQDRRVHITSPHNPDLSSGCPRLYSSQATVVHHLQKAISMPEKKTISA